MRGEHTDAVLLLLDLHADVNKKVGDTMALIEAVKNGREDVLSLYTTGSRRSQGACQRNCGSGEPKDGAGRRASQAAGGNDAGPNSARGFVVRPWEGGLSSGGRRGDELGLEDAPW